jgi:Tfp pilus assembly protein PilE
MYCPKCGQPNIDSAKFCAGCGNPIDQTALQSPPPMQTTPDTDALYRAFIGPKNQQYYLDQFHQFDREGQTSATWHWSAFLVTWYWLLYRKMWSAALLYFFLPYILMLVGGLLAAITGGALLVLIWIGYLIGIFVWYPMQANALYYKHCQNKIKEASAATSNGDVQLGMLAGKGGTSSVVIVLIVVLAIPMIGILAAIAIPAYQGYIEKAKIVQALSVGTQAEKAVAQYYQQHEALPATLADAGFNAALPKTIAKIELDASADGTIAITLADVPVQILDKKIYLVPSLEADKSLSWRCTSSEISNRFLPRVCQTQQ